MAQDTQPKRRRIARELVDHAERLMATEAALLAAKASISEAEAGGGSTFAADEADFTGQSGDNGLDHLSTYNANALVDIIIGEFTTWLDGQMGGNGAPRRNILNAIKRGA